MKKKVSDELIIKAAKESVSMRQAAISVGLNKTSFAARAKKLGVYKTNQGGIGSLKKNSGKYGEKGFPIDEILAGKFPSLKSYTLKEKLFKYKIFKNQCDVCGITDWQGKIIKCEIHHLNGNSRDHRKENLQILCPNCHSQTDTFRNKKR